jgi:DNA-binding GntR family transcriptional regulator
MVASATRAETIADSIRRSIRSGVYISGERLIELALAQRLNVSQNTVRDALRILEGEGWVVKHPRHGVRVRAFTVEEAHELYVLWAAVEGLALGWAMEKLTKSGLAGLRRLLYEARKQTLGGNPRDAADALFALHTAIASLSGKAQTIDLLSSLHNRASLLDVVRQMRAPRSLHSQEARVLLYEKLLSLMENNDVEAAQQLLHYLIMSDCEELLPLLAQAV